MAAATAGWWDYRRRLRKRQAERDKALYEQGEFEKVDRMSGPEFERYSASLLPEIGLKNIEWIGGAGDGGMDIIADDDRGRPVSVQCKRQSYPVGPGVIRDMTGAVASGRHAGRRAILMTNAHVTPQALEAAEERRVRVIQREELGHLMWQVRKRVEEASQTSDRQSGGVTGDPAAWAEVTSHTRPAQLHTDAKVTLGVVGCSVAVVFLVVTHALTSGPRHVPTQESASASSPATARAASVMRAHRSVRPLGPADVIREFFGAISHHDWQQVWRLGGKNLGRGQYASYDGMISGYRDTIRDVLTEVHVTGSTVTGGFLAYQTGGVIRPYQFTYVVRGGVIVSGRQQ